MNPERIRKRLKAAQLAKSRQRRDWEIPLLELFSKERYLRLLLEPSPGAGVFPAQFLAPLRVFLGVYRKHNESSAGVPVFAHRQTTCR